MSNPISVKSLSTRKAIHINVPQRFVDDLHLVEKRNWKRNKATFLDEATIKRKQKRREKQKHENTKQIVIITIMLDNKLQSDSWTNPATIAKWWTTIKAWVEFVIVCSSCCCCCCLYCCCCALMWESCAKCRFYYDDNVPISVLGFIFCQLESTI